MLSRAAQRAKNEFFYSQRHYAHHHHGKQNNMTKDAKNLIVGLDIGTSKVVAVVAEVMPNGRHEVIGLGQHESKGLKKGVVVNIEATVESIQRALEEAELMADCKIRNVYAGIAGSHIRSFNSSGMVA
ncbi:MAG: cell division protein FtsA, partial [Burkholderiaceae bacterium]